MLRIILIYGVIGGLIVAVPRAGMMGRPFWPSLTGREPSKTFTNEPMKPPVVAFKNQLDQLVAMAGPPLAFMANGSRNHDEPATNKTTTMKRLLLLAPLAMSR